MVFEISQHQDDALEQAPTVQISVKNLDDLLNFVREELRGDTFYEPTDYSGLTFTIRGL